MIVMRISLGYYLTRVAMVGIVGIWIAMYSDWVFRAVFFLPRFIKGKWLDHDIFAKAKK